MHANLFFSDGLAFASIWLNTTLDGQQGTFIPLSNPAVSGKRVYIIAAFKSSEPISSTDVHLRLYAIDVRPIMVERIKVIWFYDFTLHESNLPYLMNEVTECIGRYDPTDPQVGSVLFETSSNIVAATVNYRSSSGGDSGCHGTDYPYKSVLVSVTDNNDSYTVNFVKNSLPAFQAVAYASPNFTLSNCKHPGQSTLPPHVPSMWISWVVKETASSIQNINILTGSMIQTLDKIEELQNTTLTSRLSIFYNDKLMQKLYCNGIEQEVKDDLLTPLMFGYHDWKDSTNYIGAVDVTDQPEFLWKVRTFDDNAPVVGQITTVGEGRDTMMALTTTHGAYFYVLFAESN